ncbi:hypothetical protein Dimus_030145 [Dionaea muscipula]
MREEEGSFGLYAWLPVLGLWQEEAELGVVLIFGLLQLLCSASMRDRPSWLELGLLEQRGSSADLWKRGLEVGLIHGHAKLGLHGLSPSMAVISLYGCSASMACAQPTAELGCEAIWRELKLNTELGSAKPVLGHGLFTAWEEIGRA